MTATVRIYETQDAAQKASHRLARLGFNDQRILVGSDLAGQEEAAVRAAVSDGLLPGGHIKASTSALQRGRTLLAVDLPFGRGKRGVHVMNTSGAVDLDALPPIISDDPAPFSDLMGLPTLTKFESSTRLARSDWSFSSMFGLPLLSKKQGGKASSFGFKTLVPHVKKSSFGIPLLSKKQGGASSSMGFKTLTDGKSSTKLSNKPAPFSSLFGMPTLTKR
ncbi:MAG: hypothetical protein ACE363_08995 [Alphaproteobacteria bacterium]